MWRGGFRLNISVPALTGSAMTPFPYPAQTGGSPASGLYGAFLVKERHAIFVVLCHSILLFDPRRRAFFRPDRIFPSPSHAAAVKDERFFSAAEGLSLYGDFEVKHYFTAPSTFSVSSSQFLCSTWNPVSSPRPARVGRRRAQGLSRPAVALLLLTLRRLQAAP